MKRKRPTQQNKKQMPVRPTAEVTKLPKWDVGTVAQIKTKYGLSLKKWPRARLKPDNVPGALRPLIPLAEFWGITDDIVRAELLKQVAETEIRCLNEALEPFDKALAEWLGDEDKLKTWCKTDEYAAFSCMVNAADGF